MAQKKSNDWLVFALLLLLTAGCSQFISVDISSNTVNLYGPADSSYTSQGLKQFWWEEDVDVERFEIQVVTPDFQNPFLVFDTVMVGNTLEVEFTEGVYAWRIRGVNEGSETQWTERTFVVDQTAPLVPTGIYPVGDTLDGTFTAFDTLRWSSQDPPIDGFTFYVTDSIYLYQRNDSTIVSQRFYREFGTPAILEIDLQNGLSGSGNYWWQIISFDQAGNKRNGGLHRFYLR